MQSKRARSRLLTAVLAIVSLQITGVQAGLADPTGYRTSYTYHGGYMIPRDVPTDGLPTGPSLPDQGTPNPVTVVVPSQQTPQAIVELIDVAQRRCSEFRFGIEGEETFGLNSGGAVLYTPDLRLLEGARCNAFFGPGLLGTPYEGDEHRVPGVAFGIVIEF